MNGTCCIKLTQFFPHPFILCSYKELFMPFSSSNEIKCVTRRGVESESLLRETPSLGTYYLIVH